MWNKNLLLNLVMTPRQELLRSVSWEELNLIGAPNFETLEDAFPEHNMGMDLHVCAVEGEYTLEGGLDYSLCRGWCSGTEFRGLHFSDPIEVIRGRMSAWDIEAEEFRLLEDLTSEGLSARYMNHSFCEKTGRFEKEWTTDLSRKKSVYYRERVWRDLGIDPLSP